MKLKLKKVSKALRQCKPASKGSHIITPIARLSYPNLYQPRPPVKGEEDSKKKRYGLCLLIPPQCNMDLLYDDVDRAIEETWGKKPPRKLKEPFIDAAEYDYPGYEEDWTLIRATSKQRPKVLEGSSMEVIPEDEAADEVYAGRWCVASIRAFTYDTNGNRGVAFGLNNVMMLYHDEPLGGRARAEDEFEPDDDYAYAQEHGIDSLM